MSDTERALSWILKGGLLVTPFLVFVVTRSLYFPFITGKNFAFRILVELLAVVWVWAALRFPHFRPRSSPVSWAVVAFIAIMGLATLFSLSPYKSFWSDFERMEGYIGLLHLALYFLLLTSVFRDEEDWRTFFHVSLAASVIVALYAVFQLAGVFSIHQGGTRVDATFGNATYLAAYLLFHLFFLIWFFLQTPHRGWRIAYAAAVLLEAVILYYTATRGAIIGLLGGLIVLALLTGFMRRGRVRRVAFAAIGFIVLAPVLFFLVNDTAVVRKSEVLERFATISLSETTTQSRFTIWNMALAGWRERPVLGWGQESFVYVFSKYYEPSLWRQEPWFDRAHNVLLDWLTAGGMLGLAAYLSLFGTALWLLVSTVRRGALDGISASVITALLAAYFFQNLFVFDNLTSYLIFFAVLAYVHTRSRAGTPGAAAPGRGAQERERLALPLGAEVGVMALVVIGCTLALWVINVKPIRAAGAILDGLAQMQIHPPAGKVDAVLTIFQQGIELNTFGTAELREQISQAWNATGYAIAQDPAIAPQDRAKFLGFAIAELETQRHAFPSDIRAKAFLATLYLSAQRPADALVIAREALAVSDRRPQFYFIAAEAYLNSGKNDQAIAVLRTAYDLAPDYPEAVANLATVLILSHRQREAEALFQKSFGTVAPRDARYARVYAEVGTFAKAIGIYQALIAGDPENPQYHADVGVMYARSGQPARGIQEIQEAIRLAPRFRAPGEGIIKQIQSGAIR